MTTTRRGGLAEVQLDDVFPWVVTLPGTGFGGLLQGEGEGAEKVVHVVLNESPAAATISTHNHIDVVGWARSVNFVAKATAETTLLVSVRASLQADYFAAREVGQLWPTASVQVGTEWRNYSVALADMLPAETAQPMSLPAFTLAFVVQQPSGPIELWFDQVHFD
jgi:hypothetical protein